MRLLAAFCLGLLLPRNAAAEDAVLSCAAFSKRLAGTIETMGGQIETPGFLRLAHGGEDARRYDWSGIVGLTGTMTCGKADAFEDFAISIEQASRTSADLPLALKRFTELASASVCALSDAAPEACRTLARTMTQESLAQFKAAAARGDEIPVGSRDYFIVEGIDAELDMTPVAILWSIGPGEAMSTTTARRKLDPKNADQ